MYYSEEALKQLADGYASMGSKLDALLEKFFLLELKNRRALEFARQGLPRRLKVMVRCIANVFGGIPPERADLPSRDELSDATINIQSFVFNVFGAVDNLAWVWMHENGQKRHDGTSIPDAHVGLGPKNESVRASLSQEFRDYLVSLDAWFAHLADLRHALAHRIPLYIPPYVIQNKDEPAYLALEAAMVEAAKRSTATPPSAAIGEVSMLLRFQTPRVA